MERNLVKCSHCELEYPFDYVGRQPPYAPEIIFLEDAYCLKDVANQDTLERCAIFIAAPCSCCKKVVCASPHCSIFYSKRVCAACVKSETTNIKTLLPCELDSQVNQLMQNSEDNVS
mmetsp:Transcript_23968/g.31183  ORF Transcript_23968/g.31183 Transcript_23968/m.31183 type:complete len:117 (-) Transcript_23968:282-632(-)